MSHIESFLPSLLSPIYVAALSVIAAVFLKWWTERETKEYERETKHLQFFKAFYDLYSLEKPAINPEFDTRCQQLLRDASRWIEFRPTGADRLAKSGAFVLALVCGYSSTFLVDSQLRRVRVTPDLLLIKAIMDVAFEFAIAIIVIIVIYQIGWPAFAGVYHFLGRFRRFQHLTEVKW